jgi:hypothetical protein
MANQHTGGKWNVYDEQIKNFIEMNRLNRIEIVKTI